MNLSLLFVLLIVSCFIAANPSNLARATTAKYAWNFDDQVAEIAWKVNDNTHGDMENLAVTFNMHEGLCLIRGVNYKYNNVGSGPYDVGIRFEGDTLWVGYTDTGIPNVMTDSWRTFRCAGPVYLVDSDPVVRFIGTDPSDNCISICADDPSHGHSYYDVGSGWTLDNEYEYIVELIYEPMEFWDCDQFGSGGSKAGSITSTDNIDAYRILPLTTGLNYTFVLERTSGTGNLNARIVTCQDLTNDNLVQTYRAEFPKEFHFVPSSDQTDACILLVEAENAGIDTANYTIRYYTDEQHFQWTKDLDGGITASGLAKDSDDNLYVMGHDSDGCLLQRHDTEGNQLWSKKWPCNGGKNERITMDSSNNVYILYSNSFLTKFNPSGNQLWTTELDITGLYTNYPIQLSSGSSNATYIAGTVLLPDPHMFLGKYGASGNQLWNVTWRTTSWPLYTVFVDGVAVDSEDNVYVIGRNNNPNSAFGFLVKYDSNGQASWTKNFNYALSDSKIALAGDNNIIAVTGGAEYDEYVLTKYDLSGGILWSKNCRSTGIKDITTDSKGNIYICGPEAIMGGAGFLSKYDPFGNGLWSDSRGGEAVTVDSEGNVFTVISSSLTKYGKTPVLTVVSPDEDSVFGNTPPDFELEVIDPFLYETWYSLDGGMINYPLEVNGTVVKSTVDKDAWDSITNDQQVTIAFHAKDMSGHYAFKNVIVQKDTRPPEITIVSPEENENFERSPPDFVVMISDPHVDKMWYSLDGGMTNYMFTRNSTIDRDAWNAVDYNQQVTITFYANDTAGNTNQKAILITKKASPVLGYEFTAVITIAGFMYIVWRRRRKTG